MIRKINCSIIGAAILGIFTQATQMAHAADPSSAEYKAGYDAGYKAALEALKAEAAAPQTPKTAMPERQQAAAAEPRDWWNHSALFYSKLEPAWRHHVELQFSGSSLNGNDTGHAVRGSG